MRGKGGNSTSRGGRGNSNGGGGRYSADVTKGPSAWRSEWSGFISGVRMTDQGKRVKLPSVMDHNQSGEGDDEGGGVSTFSYLFSSPADRKAERDAKKKEIEAKKRERELANKRAGLAEFEGDDRSKMERAIENAQVSGVKLEGLNRKQKREMLRLTDKQGQDVAEVAVEEDKEIKPHDLMNEHIAWYQQGPYPIDEISERLIIKKAAKKAKQMGMKYNSLTVHPSWVASRANKRKMLLTVPSGIRKVFDAEGTAVLEESHNKWPTSAAVALVFGGSAMAAASLTSGPSIGFEGTASALPEATPGILLLQKYQEQQQRKKMERLEAKKNNQPFARDSDGSDVDDDTAVRKHVTHLKKETKTEKKQPVAKTQPIPEESEAEDLEENDEANVNEESEDENEESESGSEVEMRESAEADSDSIAPQSTKISKAPKAISNSKISKKEERPKTTKKLKKTDENAPPKNPTRDPKPNSKRTLKQLNFDKYGGKRPPRSVRDELKKAKLEAQQKREAKRIKDARKAELAASKDPNAPSNKQLKKQQRLEEFLSKKKATSGEQ